LTPAAVPSPPDCPELADGTAMPARRSFPGQYPVSLTVVSSFGKVVRKI
jgi:hypothetical protein